MVANVCIACDIAESAAMESVFGGRLPTSSLKSFIGHTLGASGSICQIS